MNELLIKKIERYKYLFLFLWGVIVALFIIIPNSYFIIPSSLSINPESYYFRMMPTRLETLNNSLDYLQTNLILPTNFFLDHVGASYLYYSYFGKFFGITEAWKILLIFQLMAVFAVLAIYPVLINKITNSILLALISPVLLYQVCGFNLITVKSCINWGFAWLVTISIPLLYIFFKSITCSKVFYYSFAGLCLSAAISNSIRAHSALPVFIILISIIIYKISSDRKFNKVFVCCCTILFFLFSYVLFTDIIPHLYIILTNQTQPESFGPWHTIYIGLGWEPNPFNIIFNDSDAINAARSINPDVIYLSEEYTAILKSLWLDLFKSNTGYFFFTYIKKFFVCFIVSGYSVLRFDQGLAVVAYIAINYIVIRYFFVQQNVIRNIIKKYSILFSICIVFIFGMLLYPLMAVPLKPYLNGTIAACGMLLFFVLLTLLEKLIFIITQLYNKSLSNKAENS